MSLEAITWALRQPIKHSSAKFVLVALANCAGGDSALAWPSVAYLSHATGQDRKTVVANLQRLQEWGLIEDTGKRTGTTKQIVVYRLACTPDLFSVGEEKRNGSESGTVPESEESQNRNSSDNGGKQSRFSRKESQKRDTDPSLTQRTQERGARTPTGSRLPPDWQPSDEDKAFALTERPDLSAEKEAEKFRDHWHGVAGAAGRKADWSAVWRNWIRRANAPKPGSAPAPSQAPAPQPARDWRADPESKLEHRLAYVRQQHATGAYGEGDAAAEELRQQIAEAHRLYGTPTEEPVA